MGIRKSLRDNPILAAVAAVAFVLAAIGLEYLLAARGESREAQEVIDRDLGAGYVRIPAIHISHPTLKHRRKDQILRVAYQLTFPRDMELPANAHWRGHCVHYSPLDRSRGLGGPSGEICTPYRLAKNVYRAGETVSGHLDINAMVISESTTRLRVAVCLMPSESMTKPIALLSNHLVLEVTE